MPLVNRFADFHDEITGWRHDFHAHPELLYDVERTAGIVAEKLRDFGCDEVIEGIGRTGVVGVIHGSKGDGQGIGLRADMDALPIQEVRDLPHKSKTPGKMHACGHDGHTAMLLGAAKYLAETRNFKGRAVVIFQPAEEGGAGGKAMCDDGLMERFGVSDVYGMHNMPDLPLGEFAIRPGPLMAATDTFTIEVEGKGGHAAKPHECVDPILAGAAIMQAVQAIASRNTDPLESSVVSVTGFEAGTGAFNVIPQTVKMIGTARSFTPEIRDMIETRLGEVVPNVARGYGCRAVLDYSRNYPVTVNHAAETEFAAAVAQEVAGMERVEIETPALMGGEDFSFMLEERPGAMIFIGNGPSAGLHHPEYDFNDEIIPLGCSYWARLVETRLAA